MEGPRAVRPDEMEALRRLTDVVFRPGMPEQYPQLFDSDNLSNLRVCMDDGVCASHVGMVQRSALIMGCQIKVCMVGSVATDPDYRNQGLASACFFDAVDKARHDGVDLMIVSGGRGLYTRNGCMNVGSDLRVSVVAEQIAERNVIVTDLQTGDLDLITECYRKEPVRFVRTPADYNFYFKSGWAMNAPSVFHVVRAAGTNAFLGYVFVRDPQEGKAASLVEFGGDRHAIIASLPHLFEKYGLSSINFHVQTGDDLMQQLCFAAGLEHTRTTTSGTFKFINFTQLMHKLHVRFAEILGEDSACALRFDDDGDVYTFGSGSNTLILDRDTATKAVFGTPDGLPVEILNCQGTLGESLRAILPIPTLWYGMNYV